MIKFGRIFDNVAVDVVTQNPEELFHPDIAKTFVALPEQVENGWVLEDGEWSAPASAPEPVPSVSEYRLKLTPSEFRNSFSAFEEVAILEFSEARPEGEEASETTLRKVIGVFFDRIKDRHLTTVDLGDPRNIAGLDILVMVGLLTQTRRDTIARGLPV